jgi:TetR/AcrR family transcriptional repressor of lmrAB and yxaGH operons
VRSAARRSEERRSEERRSEERRSEERRSEERRVEAAAAEATKGERTRRKLVDATAALLRRQGYHATGLSDIVAESGAPRGSLYFHFPGGKDELARAALLASSAEWRARIDVATAGARDLGEAIDATIALLADDLEASGWDNGCPVAAVALESPSELVRRTVQEHFESWLDLVTERLVAVGVPAAPARQLASVTLAALEGALLLARVTRSRAPLVAVGQALRAMIAATTGGAASVEASSGGAPSGEAPSEVSTARRTGRRGTSRRRSPRPT